MIYLDNGATTYPKPACVYDAVDQYQRHHAVNAGRGAYQEARAATEMIHQVKTDLLSLVDGRGACEVALAPSVTVMLNQILGGQPWQEGQYAYVSPYEHNAVLRPLELIRQKKGIKVLTLPLAEDLSIDLAQTEALFQEHPPALVAVTAVSNVTGYVLPAREIFDLAKAHGAFTLLDGAQAVGLLPLRFPSLRADALTFAGHKTLYATFGIAGAYLRNGVNLEPFLAGGNGIRSEDSAMPKTLPEKLECGSMDTPAIAGLAASLQWLRTVNPWQIEAELMAYLLSRLSEVPGITLYRAPGGPENQAGVVSLNLEGFRANEVAAILDHDAQIAVRAGHHCAGLIHQPLQNQVYDGTVRISLGVFNTREDVDILVDALKAIDRETLKGIDASVLRGNC